ncbi:MAG: DUF262 domain-containing protein [Bacteroidota bacterium]
MTANIDALIPREDFEVKENIENPLQTLPALQVRDLEEHSFVYKTLRKPDFQRETSDWTEEKIFELIQSFINGDLIPAVILWNSSGYNFVIDGAHRLSAIIAWVTDDYGDGPISKSFFGFNITPEQIEVAEKTRKLINKKIGSYKEHVYAINNPDKVEKTLLGSAQRLATLTVQLQWVRGDAKKAEASFFKINEQASPINDTEKKLLKSRKKPNSIAARAIIRSGTGHKYWSKFATEKQSEIESLAKEINDILFTPKLQTPIKTLDVPLAGRGYSSQTLTLILDLINITNNVADTELTDDETGDETISMLKRTKKILGRISGTHPSSLGLHPVVYFYSTAGRYQVTAFMATLELFKELDLKNKFEDFIKIRKRFEDFLIKYKNVVNQINFKYGSGLKSYKRLHKLYLFIIDHINRNTSDQEIVTAFSKSSDYNFLTPEAVEIEATSRKEFSTETKSAVFLRDALLNPLRCKICDGLIHRNSISIDHIDRKQDGGKGNIENGQLTHPYCNSTIKN